MKPNNEPRLIDKLKQPENRNRLNWILLVSALCAVVLFYIIMTRLPSVGAFFKGVFKVLAPIIIGAVVAYALNPIARFLESRVFRKLKSSRLSWQFSALISLILLLLLIAALLLLLIPRLVTSITDLIRNINTYLANLQQFISKLHLPESLAVQIKAFLEGDLIERLITLLTNNISKILSASANVGSTLLNIGIGFIFSIYFLFGKKHVTSTLGRLEYLLVSDRHYVSVHNSLKKFNDIFSRYIICEILDGLLVGGLTALFMVIMKMPYAAVIAVTVGVTNLAPTFGPIVGAVFGSVILLLTDPSAVIWFLIFTVLLQIADGYIIKPRMFGNVLQVSPLLILIFLIVAGKLFGVIGLLLAIPIAAIVEYLYKVAFIPWLKQRKAREKEAAMLENEESEEEFDEEFEKNAGEE